MPTYSHSKLSTFEQCPYKYKLHYIDKEPEDIPTTIEYNEKPGESVK